MNSSLAMNRRRLECAILFSPVAVLLIGQLMIRLFALIWGLWSWLPFWIVYILVLGFFIYLQCGWKEIQKWLVPSKGHGIWALMACGIPVAMTLPIFIPNWWLLIPPAVMLSTLLFVAINPFVEEFYWRGTLLDATRMWPRWVSLSYSVLGFALHHLWIGVIAAAGRHPSALAGPILIGIVWRLTYRATGSLRWAIVGHFLANLFSLSVPVFLNLWIPPR